MEKTIEGIIWINNYNRPVVFKRLGVHKQHSLVIKAVASSKNEVCKKLRMFLETNVISLGDYRDVLDKTEYEFGETLEKCIMSLKTDNRNFLIQRDKFKVQYAIQETYSTVDVLL